MSALSVLHELESHVAVRDGSVELFRYTYRPDSPVYESPKPYIHPIRTRAGHVVSLFRPHDHVWHKGIAWSLPVVGDENFWGGPTYVHGQFYVQLPNNGTQLHTDGPHLDVADGLASVTHGVEWFTQAGARVFAETRRITARILDADSWALTFETTLANVSEAPVAIGSPTTKGRPNAGYGGLFWRGPRSFSDGTLVAPGASGAGDDVRGSRHEWMGFVGKHDHIDATSLVLMVDDTQNPHHPPQWFARSEEFAALNPAPFFSEELVIEPGASATFRYGVGIADADAAGAESLASAVRGVLGEVRG